MSNYIGETKVNYQSQENRVISCSSDVYEEIKEYAVCEQEHFITIYLDGANRIIETRVNFIGTLNQSLVHPRDIFRTAVRLNVASIIIVHNHPSNILRPSEEDLNVTQRIKESGQVLGIDLLDHIIISSNGYYSFKSKNIL
ncbi:JAB domain-containing protein [Malaciobacter marinus]|uniref:JAB domain-containing protein n=1 Tax=Malaciobacter marinus TaxID=505249 RepID=UPI003B00D184